MEGSGDRLRGGRGLASLCFVSLLLAGTLSAALAADTEGPAQRSLFLTVGSSDQMKTRNILSLFAWTDPHTMAVLARVYDTAVQRDARDGSLVPRLAGGGGQNADGILDPGERGRFSIPAGASTVTVFYDFTNATFHDRAPVTVMTAAFS